MASESKNRSLRPWIIVFGHRPMYCSSDTEEDCSFEANILKCCFFNSSRYSLESLFRQNRVDLCFWGHMHYYERSWPIYNNQVYNGSFFQPYRNPGATVHVITGAAVSNNGIEKLKNDIFHILKLILYFYLSFCFEEGLSVFKIFYLTYQL